MLEPRYQKQRACFDFRIQFGDANVLNKLRAAEAQFDTWKQSLQTELCINGHLNNKTLTGTNRERSGLA